MLKNLVRYLIACLVLSSCTTYEIPSDITSIIENTKNKSQLLKTLNHYNNKKDSLKFQATCFLIRNMFEKGNYGGEKVEHIDEFFKIVIAKQNKGKKLTEKELEPIWDSLYQTCPQNIEFKNDLDNITYRFLKNNIDRSFELWKNMPYCRHVSFRDFLNYILPYRANNEALEDNKKWLSEKFNWVADSLKDKTDPVAACILINTRLKSKITFFDRFRSYPGNISIKNAYDSELGICSDMANLGAMVMRSVGIPVTIDYTTQFANISSGHSWDVVFDKNMKAHPFLGTESNPGEISNYRETEKAAKVFRMTYEFQNDGIEDTTENIPTQFRKKDYLDVTNEYTKVSDIVLHLTNIPEQTHYCYLCIFNNQFWNPVYWGKVQDDKATFLKMGRGVMYLPVYYVNQKYAAAGDPVLLTENGKILNYSMTQEKIPSMKLTRKYPLFIRIKRYIERMKGGKFQGANMQNFSDAVDLFKIQDPLPYMNEADIKINQKFRYVRYIGPDTGYSDISELEFYNRNRDGKLKKIDGKIIGKGENFLIYKEAFDNNWDSYFYSNKKGLKEWVGLSFDEPQSIQKIKYLPRTDDNAVRPGDEYELLYWNKGWNSLGKKSADNYFLIFNNIPKNTIYWLRDKTRGKEERIFTYENGEQVWW